MNATLRCTWSSPSRFVFQEKKKKIITVHSYSDRQTDGQFLYLLVFRDSSHIRNRNASFSCENVYSNSNSIAPVSIFMVEGPPRGPTILKTRYENSNHRTIKSHFIGELCFLVNGDIVVFPQHCIWIFLFIFVTN